MGSCNIEGKAMGYLWLQESALPTRPKSSLSITLAAMDKHVSGLVSVQLGGTWS